MKLWIFFLTLCAVTASGGAATLRDSAFVDVNAGPTHASFSLGQAQALADAERFALHGMCGMTIFKKREGRVWIFEAKVGYGGRSADDISVTEPAVPLPRFRGASQEARQSVGLAPLFEGLPTSVGSIDEVTRNYVGSQAR